MSSLIVNLDDVAILREIIGEREPDPIQAALLAELAGADGVSVQVRRDRKYIRERDLYLLKGVVKTKLILELSPTESFIEKVQEIKPWLVIFVADHTDSDSPVSSIDFEHPDVDFRDITESIKSVGVNVGFFVEPNNSAIKGAVKSGANAVLVDSTDYTHASGLRETQKALDTLDGAILSAAKADLTVCCGQGIGYKNIVPLVELGNIDEFIVGHAISSRAMLVGYERAVKEMMSIIQRTNNATV